MARLPNILPALLKQKSSLIDQALSEALRSANPDELGPLSQAVLQRDRPDRSVGLILRFHELPAEARHTIVERAEELASAVRRAATRHGQQGAKNALTLIERAASTRMAYLVTALMRHKDPDIRDRAADCLRGLARRCNTVERGTPAHLDAVSAAYLTQAVEQAVVLFANHQQPAVLEAMAQLLPRPMPEAYAALSSSEHPAVSACNDLARDAASWQVRSALLSLVSLGPIRLSAVDGLCQANHAGKLDDPLRNGHLLALPAVHHALRRTHDPQRLWPNAKHRGEMPEDAQRHLPAFAHALPMDPQERVLRLAGLARSKYDATRLATLRALLNIATDPSPQDKNAAENANDAIATFTNDPLMPLARTALWHLIRIQYTGLPRILANLVNSKHPQIRAVASRHLAPLGFDRLWQAWPKLDPKRRLSAGRALIKIDPDFHRHLGTRLGSQEPAIRLRALGIVAMLGQGGFFEPAMLELAGSDDPRIVASAIRALGDCTSEQSKRVLELALEHDDARIRANAVEAIAKSDASRHLSALIALADDDQQRPRANAIKALLELSARDALPALTKMLSDLRPEHRVSALWLIDELGLLQLARQVAEMSITDDDARVKQRAGHVIQHLIEDLEHQAAEQDASTEAA
ncbi:MAG: HEAT repeat domain-containing protein [Phycisphaerales bacterium JB063]